MKKSSQVFQLLTLAVLVSTQAHGAASSCDLEIKSVSQADGGLQMGIYSSAANINPFNVKLMQNGQSVGTWSKIVHKSGDDLKITGISSSGIAIVRIESAAKPTCFVEKEISLSPNMPVLPANSKECALVITSSQMSGNALLLDIHSPTANINPFNVRLVQDSKELGNWKNVAHSRDQLLRVEGVSGSGTATVTIESAKRSDCVAQSVIKLPNNSAGSLSQCKQGPVIGNISNITSTKLLAQFHGEDVFGMDYLIQDSKGASVAAGQVVPTNNTPSISYPALSNGKYKLTLKGNTCSGESSKDFTITGSIVNPPEIIPGLTAACKSGPTILNIKNISNSGLTAQFHGEDVFGIDFKILNKSGAAVSAGSFKPADAYPMISYSPLGAGDYTLVFYGNTCAGESSKTFTIPGDVVGGGGTSGAPQGGADCKAGPEINEINKITSKSLEFKFHGEGVNGLDYIVKNSSGAEVATGAMAVKSNTQSISYSSQNDGDYTLVIKGNTCVGGSSKGFKIATNVVVPPVSPPVTPPVIVDPSPSSGTKVQCGGYVWTHGELLGKVSGTQPAYVHIHENRIYLKYDGSSQVFDNKDILYHMGDTATSAKFSGTYDQKGALISTCVNNADPSTYATGLLQGRSGDAIICNGKRITNDMYLGYFLGNGVKTHNYAMIDANDRLKINLWREENGSQRDKNGRNNVLLQAIIAGEDGSKMTFPLTPAEGKECFWGADPLPAQPL